MKHEDIEGKPLEAVAPTKTAAPLPNILALVAEEPELRTKVEFKHGIILDLRYIPKTVLNQIAKESTTFKYNDKTKNREPELDSTKLIPKLCQKAVVGWEGVTARSLSKIVPMNLGSVPKEHWDTPIEFSQPQIAVIAEKAYGLDTFIQNTATDVSYFSTDTDQQESELKN